jgi:hypothetical protein
VRGVTDIVSNGPTDNPPPAEPAEKISYRVGPTQASRILAVAAAPLAFAVSAIVVGLGSMMVVEPANDVANVKAILHRSGSELTPYRWSSGIRLGLAVVALVLAVVGVRLLIGRRPEVHVTADTLEGDNRTLDQIEDAAVANVANHPDWMRMIAGAGMLVAIVSVLLNTAAFAYAMAASQPTAVSPIGF